MNLRFANVGLGLILCAGVSSSESRVARADLAPIRTVLEERKITLKNIATRPEVLFLGRTDEAIWVHSTNSNALTYLQEGTNTFSASGRGGMSWTVTLFAIPASSELGTKLLKATNTSNWKEYRAKGKANIAILSKDHSPTKSWENERLKSYVIGNPIKQSGNYKIVPLQNGRYALEPLSPSVNKDKPAAQNAPKPSPTRMLVVPLFAGMMIMLTLVTRRRGVRSTKTEEQKPDDHVD